MPPLDALKPPQKINLPIGKGLAQAPYPTALTVTGYRDLLLPLKHSTQHLVTQSWILGSAERTPGPVAEARLFRVAKTSN